MLEYPKENKTLDCVAY